MTKEELRARISVSIKTFRESRNLTQAELAKLAALRPATISDIERGLNLPDLDTLWALADGLHLTMDELIGRQSITRRRVLCWGDQKEIDAFIETWPSPIVWIDIRAPLRPDTPFSAAVATLVVKVPPAAGRASDRSVVQASREILGVWTSPDIIFVTGELVKVNSSTHKRMSTADAFGIESLVDIALHFTRKQVHVSINGGKTRVYASVDAKAISQLELDAAIYADTSRHLK